MMRIYLFLNAGFTPIDVLARFAISSSDGDDEEAAEAVSGDSGSWRWRRCW